MGGRFFFLRAMVMAQSSIHHLFGVTVTVAHSLELYGMTVDVYHDHRTISITRFPMHFQRSLFKEDPRPFSCRQYLRALGRLYWELGRVVLHRCCSSSWSVLVLELRAMSPAVVRAALLGELGGTASVTLCMGFFQMDPRGGAGEVSLPLLKQDGLAGSLRMHVHAPAEGVGTCRLQVHEADSQVEALAGHWV